MFIVFLKTAKDSDDKLHKSLPGEYPVLTTEVETEEEAAAKHPGLKVMRVEDYKHYQEALQIIYNHVSNKKQWWKFWGKK